MSNSNQCFYWLMPDEEREKYDFFVTCAYGYGRGPDLASAFGNMLKAIKGHGESRFPTIALVPKDADRVSYDYDGKVTADGKECRQLSLQFMTMAEIRKAAE